jgi:hypothetical protein
MIARATGLQKGRNFDRTWWPIRGVTTSLDGNTTGIEQTVGRDQGKSTNCSRRPNGGELLGQWMPGTTHRPFMGINNKGGNNT